jgi:histidine ammonia-lyase
MSTYKISNEELDLETLEKLLEPGQKIGLSDEAKSNISKCRTYLDKKLKEVKEPLYGINTGFGALYHKSIPESSLSQLQHNLLMSHACGTGEMVPEVVVKLMLLLKIKGLAFGNSGVQLETVERLINFFNEDIKHQILVGT